MLLDRLKEWITSLLGLLLLAGAGYLLYLGKITMGEFSAFMPVCLGLLWAKNSFITDIFKAKGGAVLLILLWAMSATCHASPTSTMFQNTHIMSLKQSAERYLTLYPDRDKVYATPDGNFFLTKSDAINHARASKCNYFEFERGKHSSENDPDLAQADAKASLKERAMQIDPDKGDYREMLTILKGLNLAAESNKKADVISAFKNYQASALPAPGTQPETPAE